MSDQAHIRMERAKALYTKAARAALEGLPMAEAMTKAALDEVKAARAEMEDTRPMLATFNGPEGER